MKTNIKSLSKLKKILSTLLCICMLFTLVPVFPASAADEVAVASDTIEVTVSGDESGTKYTLPADYKGQVMRYEIVDTTAGVKAAKLTVGVYGIQDYVASYSIRLKYDPSAVGFANSGGTAASPLNYSSAIQGAMVTSEVSSILNGYNTPVVDYAGGGIWSATATVFDTGIIWVDIDSLNSAVTGIDGAIPNDGDGAQLYVKDKIVDLYSIYFISKSSTVSIADMGAFFEFLPLGDDNALGPHFIEDSAGNEVTTSAMKVLGLPETTYSVDFTILAPEKDEEGNDVGLSDVVVNLVNNSDSSKTYTFENTEDKAVISSDGTFTAKLPAATYTLTVDYKGEDENYKDKLAQYKDTAFVVDVPGEEETTNQAETIQMTRKSTDTYEVKVKVVDGDNGNVALSGAKVYLSLTEQTTISSGETTYSGLSATSYTLKVVKDGYETFGDDTTSALTLSSAGITVTDAYKDKLACDGTTVTVVMSTKKTEITAGLPIPADGDGNTITASDMDNIKAVITANPEGTTPATLSLPITVTTTASGGNQLVVDTNAETGDITDIDLIVNLPPGNYKLTISGAGIESRTTNLDVVAASGQTTVTIGGTLDTEDGTVSGGVSQWTTSDTVTVDGVAESADSGLNTITVITDPLYYAVGEFNSDRTKMTVEVYLKNISASMGTFGIKYDTNIFSAISYTINTANVQETAVNLVNTDGSSGPAVPNPTTGDGYHAFVWEIDTSGDAFMDTTEAKLIATYELTVKTDVVNSIESKMHNKALYIMPYNDTAAATMITEYYAATDYPWMATRMISDSWRDLDYDVENVTDNPGELADDLALENGFFQVTTRESATAEETYNADVRTQFVFDDFGKVQVTVQVKGPDNKPLEGVTVNVYPFGTTDPTGIPVSATATTDANGEATFAWPANTDLALLLKKANYLPYPTDGIALQVEDVIKDTDEILGPYTMTKQEGHPVVLDDVTASATDSKTTADKVNLLGDALAYNGLDYYFSLEPKPGYAWTSGLPAPGDLKITLQDVAGDIDAADETLIATEDYTWDATTNRYKIAASAIKGAPATAGQNAGTITILLDESTEAKITESASYVITATAGTNGTVNNMQTDTETLTASNLDSKDYVFKPADGYVVDKVIVNGVAMTPTDAQRAGFTYKFTNVSSDQDILVTFGTDLGGGVIEPSDNNAILNVTVGQYGKAGVTYDSTTANLVGSDTATYLVDADGNVTIAVEALTAQTQPDGTTADYVIDQVLVDGVRINDGVNTAWVSDTKAKGDDRTGTLTISADSLVAGAITSVVITFRTEKENETDDPTPIQAVVETSVADGQGSIVATGTNIYTVGDTPTFTIKALNDTWYISALNVTKPGATAADDKKGEMSGDTYTVDALEAGITKLEAYFKEETHAVVMKIDLTSGIAGIVPAANPVSITFVRAEDGEELPFTDGVDADGTAGEVYNIPQGTWKVIVEKKGFLKYTINGFKITEVLNDDTGLMEIKAFGIDSDDSSEVEIYSETDTDGNTTIYFGRAAATATASAEPIPMRIGDADHDSIIISLDDVAQVINGMLKNATEGQLNRADFTENGSLDEEMGLVKKFYGSWYTTIDCADFLK